MIVFYKVFFINIKEKEDIVIIFDYFIEVGIVEFKFIFKVRIKEYFWFCLCRYFV